jgi:hypothetical protein
MRSRAQTLLLLCSALLSVQPASGAPLSVPGDARLLLKVGATDCKGPIATEAHPITGAARLARMRKEGRLPDRFVCGRCEYLLGGDPGAAFYVKKCR